MIEIQYSGRFGNQLFQYAIGRIISDQKKQKLIVSNSNSPQDNLLERFQQDHLQDDYSIKGENPMVVGGFRIDYDMIFNHDGKIILYGYFQDYENFLPYKDFVKSLYQFEKKTSLYDDDLIGVHIRLTDYFNFENSLEIEHYIKVIEQSGKRPVIYTDDPTSPDILEIKKHFNCSVKSNSCWDDFVELSSYKNICISQSSYSWWAAWLSNAETIYYPLSSKRYWQHSGNGNDINLIVTDEDRYIFV